MCLKTTFKSWAATYKAKWKGVEHPETADAEGENNNDKNKRDDQQNRRHAHRINEIAGEPALVESGLHFRKPKSVQTFMSALGAPLYDFLFDRAYQSTGKRSRQRTALDIATSQLSHARGK